MLIVFFYSYSFFCEIKTLCCCTYHPLTVIRFRVYKSQTEEIKFILCLLIFVQALDGHTCLLRGFEVSQCWETFGLITDDEVLGPRCSLLE